MNALNNVSSPDREIRLALWARELRLPGSCPHSRGVVAGGAGHSASAHDKSDVLLRILDKTCPTPADDKTN